MKHPALALLFVSLTFPMLLGQERQSKSIITYLGTNHILLDGCPDPKCDGSEEAVAQCLTKHTELRAKYSACTQSEEGQNMGCVTYKINKGAKELSVPVYANRCSAMCYEGDPQGMLRVKKCPHPGTRQHGQDLQNLF